MDLILLSHPYNFNKNYLPSTLTFDHPLKQAQTTVVDSKGTRGNPRSSFGSNTSSRSSSVSILTDPLAFLPLSLDGSTDPLSQFARQEQELKDPLSEIASEYENYQKKTKANKDEVDSPPNWSSKRLGILNRFTTSEKLSISTSFLQGGTTIKAQTVVADKVKFRLEQLDEFEDGTMAHMMDLSQQEYIQRIEELNQELVQSWHNDQRVKALKIAIQCSKMLADTTVLSFYPSQFVLITDILDIFGKLVYERLSQKANHVTVKSSNTLKYDSQKESARETCQNWFFKIASIRELLPRLYLEMAIIKCYEFLTQSEFEEILMRITRMLRGIGDPLVSTYARCYLVRVGLTVTSSKEYIRENINDFLSVYHMIFSGAIRSDLNRQRIDLSSYLSLYGPALDFMMQSLVHKTNIFTEELLNKCKDVKNNGPLLQAILNAFKPEFIASNALDFVKILANSSSEGVLKSQLFRALGSSASRCPPLQEQRLTFLNAAFQTINTFSDPNDYINCVETWAQFIAENLTVNEVNQFLADIRTRLSQTKRDKHYTSLQSILYKILQHFKDIELLLIQEHFLPYLDLFQKESSRIEVCKHILETFKYNSQDATTSDAIVTNSLMYIGKMLNDYVTALTVEDERRQITQLISSFIHKVDFRRDFERQLSFYVEARGAFSNLEAVYITLVHAVNKLAIETHNMVQGTHTSKTAAFVKACVAYCFITIPSISAVQVQMDLYLLSGQVALLNLCLGQADSCFEAALQLVSELPRSIEIDGKMKSLETYLVSYLCNMLATLIVVPDSPEQGVLYLLRLLLEVVNKFQFETNSTGPTIIYLHALDMLYVQSLEDFPYHIPEVVSNDELYGHDPKFLAEINNISAQVVEQILSQLKQLGQTQRATLSLDLLTRIVRYTDLSNAKTFQLSTNLWMLALKYENQIDAKLITQAFRRMEEMYNMIKDNTIHKQHLQALKQLLLLMRGKSH